MAFHIPFNQRSSRQRPMGPIYIGFEAPIAPRRKFNWWGFHGMWMSFASLLTAGFTSFIPLIISMVGLRKPGKKMATVGTVVSLIGVIMAGGLVTAGVTAQHHRQARRDRVMMQRKIEVQLREAQPLMESARDDLIEFRGAHDGLLPPDLEGNMMVVSYVDPWGRSLRYEPESGAGTIRSAGPDRKFLTDDDLAERIEGQTEVIERLAVTSEE